MAQVTFKGNTMTLQGQTIQQGQQAPQFQLLNQGLETITLDTFRGQVTMLNVVPSLDTPVCQIQSRQFFQRLQNMPVQLVTVSMDLPFAQKRFCGAEGMETMMTLSDHRNANFGEAYGLLLPDLRLLTRAVVIIDAQGAIAYCEVVPEVTSEPNYDAAMQALEALTAARV
ncbi:MAG: thiol peroxidase [Vampirovibrionales bacterium]